MTSSAREPLARTLLHYASGRLFKHVLGVVVAFLRPKLLSPDHFGVWTLLRTLPSYASYSHLGARSSMRLLVPQHLARQEQDRVVEITDATYAGSSMLNGLVALALVVAAAWPGLRMETRIGLVCMAGVVLLQFAEEFAISILRAHERFPAVNAATYLGTGVTFVLTLPGLYWFGLYGLFASILLSHAAVLLYLRTRTPVRPRWRWNGPLFRDLVRRGFPVALTNVVLLLVQTADRFVVGGMLGTEALGQYGVAVLVISFLSNVPGAAREVLEPRMMQELETGNSVGVLEEYVLKPLANTAWLMPFLIGPIFLLLPVLLPLLLPKYADGVVPTQILLCGAYYLTLSLVTHTLIFARSWQWAAVGVVATVLVLNVGLGASAARLGFGLPGVAAASSLAFLLLFGGLFALCTARTRDRGNEWGRTTLAALLALPAAAAMAAGLRATVPLAVSGRLAQACVEAAAFLALFAVAHRWASGRFRLIARWPGREQTAAP